jgi:hypothetical protein
MKSASEWASGAPLSRSFFGEWALFRRAASALADLAMRADITERIADCAASASNGRGRRRHLPGVSGGV